MTAEAAVAAFSSRFDFTGAHRLMIFVETSLK